MSRLSLKLLDNRMAVAVLIVLLVLPIVWPLLPVLDGTLFPVTTKVQFIDVRPVDGGMSVRMQFVKKRDCQLIGQGVDREGIPIQFEPISGEEPITLPSGLRVSRPWFIGTDSLDGVRLIWVHRCSAWFTTITIGYP